MAENVINEKPATTPQAATEDLSKEIELSLERQPDERIKIVRVSADCYRCNWWVQDVRSSPAWIVTGTIRKSRFLRATRTTGGLQIENVG